MSNALFPTLPGLTWDVKKTPTWSTKIQQSTSGKELRASYYSWPQYRYTLTYDLLRQSSGLQELQTLAGFFNARQGKYDSFLFPDPNDNAVTAHGFGMGDGATTAYQLQRSLAGPRQADTISGIQPLVTTPRANLLVFSQDLTQAQWNKDTGATVTAGVQDPMGLTNGQQIATTVISAGVWQSPGTLAVNGSQWTFSVWLRATAPLAVKILLYRSGGGGLDIESVTVNVTTQWTRYSITHSAAWSGSSALVVAIQAQATTPAVQCFGAQLEAGTSATQYILAAGTGGIAAPAYWPATGDGFEPIFAINYATPPQIFVNGTLKALGTDYTMAPTGLVTFTAAPAANAALTWSGAYWFRARFDLDAAEFNNFLYQLWDLKTITLVTVKE